MDKNRVKSTVIIIFFIIISFSLFPDNPVETFERLEKQLDEPTISRKEKLRLLTQLCQLEQESEPVKAVKYGKKALEILSQMKEDSLEIRVLLALTEAARNIGEYETALEHGYKAETLAVHMGDKKAAAAAYNHISRICHHLGFLDRSLDYALRALKWSEKPEDHKNVAEAYKNIGNVYLALKNNKQALKQYQKSLDLLEELGDKKGIALVLISIGNVYQSSRRYSKALGYYRESRIIVEKLDWQMGRAAALGSIAAVYSATGDPARAMTNNLRALNICKKIGQKRMISILLCNIGVCYRQLGQYEKASPYVYQALDIAEKIKNKDITRNFNQELFNIYIAIKEYELAYIYFNKSKAINDKIFSQECRKNISQLWQREEKFVGLIQDNTIQKLKLEHQGLVRNFLTVVSLLALLLTAVIYSRYRTKKKAERLLTESERKLRDMNTSKDKLFSIIAHDLESPLNGLLLSSGYLEKKYNTMEEKQIKEFLHQICENTHQMARLLDNLLQWAMSQLGKLEVNLEILELSQLTEDTLRLMAPAAAEKNIRLFSRINENTRVWADKRMVETILRNLVSNAIKYSSAGGTVQVSSNSNGNFLEVTVSDTGVGIPADKLHTLFNPGVRTSTRGTAGEKGIGLGLVLCKEFVEKNGGTIRVENNKSNQTQPGARVVFTLPTVHGECAAS
ncbi:MAG: tetratricopeptide repeat-containing sensor histidine kinase [Candidatus Aminicenantes bacterium]|jgi:signal transduction histidine kinase